MTRRVPLTDEDLEIAEQACRSLAERYRWGATYPAADLMLWPPELSHQHGRPQHQSVGIGRLARLPGLSNRDCYCP